MKMKTPNSGGRNTTGLRIVKVTTIGGASKYQGLLMPNTNNNLLTNNSSTSINNTVTTTANDSGGDEQSQSQPQQRTITIESIMPTKTTNSSITATTPSPTIPNTNTIINNNHSSMGTPNTSISITTTTNRLMSAPLSSSSSTTSSSSRKKFNRFSDKEKSILFSMFKEYQSIIDIKHRKHSYSSHKQSEVRDCWDLILSRFNVHSDTKKRTMRQVQKFWLNSKLRNSLPKELLVPMVAKIESSSSPPPPPPPPPQSLPIISTTTKSESSTSILLHQQEPPPLTSISNCSTTIPNDSKTLTRITKTEYLDITNGDYIIGTACGVDSPTENNDSNQHHQEMEIEQQNQSQIIDEHDVDDEEDGGDEDGEDDDVDGDETSRLIELKFIETDQTGTGHINHQQASQQQQLTQQQQQQHHHQLQHQQQQIRLTTLQIHPTHDNISYTMDTSNLENKDNLQLHHHHHHQHHQQQQQQQQQQHQQHHHQSIAIPVTTTTANDVETTLVPTSRRLFCGSDCGDGNLDDDNHKILTTTTTVHHPVEEKLSTTNPLLFNAGQQQEQIQQHQQHQQQQQQQQQSQLPVQQTTAPAVGYIDLMTYEDKMNSFRLQEIEYRVKESQLRCDLQRLAVTKAQEEMKQMREIHSLRIREMQLKLDRMKKDLRHINNYDHDDLGN